MRAELRPAITQQQKLSVEQQQGLRFLQMPAEQLLAEATLWAEDNPFLESIDCNDTPSSVYEAWSAQQNSIELFEPSAQESLREMLLEQLLLSNLNEDIASAIRDLIDEIDEEGFLNPTAEDLAHIDASRPQAVWDLALSILRNFEPAGIACASSIDAVLEQIRRLVVNGELGASSAQILSNLFSTQLSTLAAIASASPNEQQQLALHAGIDATTLTDILAILPRLDPHPARPWSETAPTVIPECFIQYRAGHWIPIMNPEAYPRLRLIRSPDLSNGQSTSWHALFQEAKQLLVRIEMRRETLTRIIRFLVDRQQAFFNEGPNALLPLSQKDIAESLGLAESTISRAMAGKYLQCQSGTFEWKRLLAASTGELATDTVRARIVCLIKNENPFHPLSDASLEKLLAKEGICIARRTIAKYRELEGIPSTRERRRLASASR